MENEANRRVWLRLQDDRQQRGKWADDEASEACDRARFFVQGLADIETYFAQLPRLSSKSTFSDTDPLSIIDQHPSVRIVALREQLVTAISSLEHPGPISSHDKVIISKCLYQAARILSMLHGDIYLAAGYFERRSLRQHDLKRADTARKGKAPSQARDAKIMELATATRQQPGKRKFGSTAIGKAIEGPFNEWLSEQVLANPAFRNAKPWSGDSLGRRVRDLSKAD